MRVCCWIECCFLSGQGRGGSLRFWGPGLLSTSPAFSMSSASHSAGSSGWLAPKTGAGPTFQWAGKVYAICRSRSNRAKRPRAGCILRSTALMFSLPSHGLSYHIAIFLILTQLNYIWQHSSLLFLLIHLFLSFTVKPSFILLLT